MNVDLARWQFAITTVYHFLFVPVSIGMASYVALCQTLYWRTGKEAYDRMARFWGKLFLIVFALGVATGIVQEFQFGMNWSDYSRYVGDIFGAPLAIEGLAAFFLESTFLGLWIFGRDKLSPGLHVACIWMVAIGTALSAYFILAANSWMQHPVGYEINPMSGRAELTSIFDVLTNSTLLYAFPHTILGAFATAGMLVIAVSAWHLLRRRDVDVFGPSVKLAAPIVLVATIATSIVGHYQGMLLVEQQPMKMAAAEALFETAGPAPFSLFATGDWTPNPERTNVDIQVPDLLSFLATGKWDAEVRGINDLNAEYQAKYGPGQYAPIVGLTYWSFRAMIGAGTAMILLTALLLFRARRNMLVERRKLLWLMVPAALLPFIANSAGWIFTEVGRQPWAVQGLLKTADAVSPTVNATSVLITMAGFTLLYGVLAVIGFALFARTAAKGAPRPDEATPTSELTLAY
ncbi:cytochrome ubiquinol oxidase subunit I [Solirubrobacter phytolaccae]|uniref:Cytochrome ubiquinol oxidase subunit I n=1 Tax=Solirubrobacter phytolaccae TaxID=1404360 RepID=A0A9X3NB28_9ACTN|nr:cytochrome ubiquinol oxidase subunit I [Solirubrobacter phytolaccae]MDA0183113.1 cytochrome ubiquinol oxidase subunit I [Solirubrobacter phytolaccae]